MGKLARDALKEESDFELPISMIDVVFLLLIFFIVSAKFKQVVNRIDAHLPKDEGQDPIESEIETRGWDDVVRLWDPFTGDLLLRLDSRATGLQFSPDDRRLAAGMLGPDLVIWDKALQARLIPSRPCRTSPRTCPFFSLSP